MRLQADVGSSCYELLPNTNPIRVNRLQAILWLIQSPHQQKSVSTGPFEPCNQMYPDVNNFFLAVFDELSSVFRLYRESEC